MAAGTSALLQLASPMPALQPWLMRCAKEMAARASGALELPVRFSCAGVTEEQAFALLSRLDETGYFRRLEVQGSNEVGLVQVDNDLAGCLVSRLLGGQAGVLRLCRELTLVEIEVLAPLVTDVLGVLDETVGGVMAASFQLTATETLTSLARRLCPGGGVVVAEFGVTVGEEAAGSLRIALPGRWAARLERRLARPSDGTVAGRPLLSLQQVEQLPVTVVVETAPVRTTTGQMATLKQGSVLRLTEDPSERLALASGGELVGFARPSVRGARKAVLVTARRER
jgi:flagellar motor switch protein FliM